jgi:hypothetical protein
MRCVHLRQQTYDSLLTSIEEGVTVDSSYKNIKIKSANPDIGEYNFYAAACGIDDETWYGYRALCHSTFSTFCGAIDTLAIGTPLTELYVNDDVLYRNENWGAADLSTLYSPACLLNYFKYEFEENYAQVQLPPAYKECPFLYVSGGTSSIDKAEETASEAEADTSESSQDVCEDDKQSVGDEGETASRVHPGSTPMREISNCLENEATRQGLKRKRQQARVIDDDDNGDGGNHKV